MIVKNKDVLSPLFWGAMRNLMAVQALDVKLKMSLVKFRREIQTHSEDVKELTKTVDIKELDDYDYAIKNEVQLDLERLAGYITADDIYHLSSVFS